MAFTGAYFVAVIRSRAERIRALWDASRGRGETPVVKLIQSRDDSQDFRLLTQDLTAFLRDIPASQAALAAHLSAFGPDTTKVTILFILRPQPGVIEPNVLHVPPDRLETVQVADVQAMRFVPGVN